MRLLESAAGCATVFCSSLYLYLCGVFIASLPLLTIAIVWFTFLVAMDVLVCVNVLICIASSYRHQNSTYFATLKHLSVFNNTKTLSNYMP